MRLLVTRPAAESARLGRRLAALGHEPVMAPVMTIRPIADTVLPLDGVTAILVTSVNGVASLALATTRRDLPVYAVGDRTAAAARTAGFPEVESADGDVETLAGLIIARRDPAAGALLHATGATRAGDLAGTLRRVGFEVRVVSLYESVPAPSLAPAALRALQLDALDGVLLFSPRTAEQFVKLLSTAGLDGAAGALDAWCLSESVADALAACRFRRIHIAPHPTEASLLEALATAPCLTAEP
jgi:uroporphyrinogen-III synthase